MSDAKTLPTKIDRALEEVFRISRERGDWRMSIPADPHRDSDLIISDALRSAREAIAAPLAPEVVAVLRDALPIVEHFEHPCGGCGATWRLVAKKIRAILAALPPEGKEGGCHTTRTGC